jgi:N4-gp56 family major capsid protein
MTTKTSVPSGAAGAMFVQAAGLFAQSMQRNSTLGRLSGPIPQGEASAAGVVRKQSTTDMPIVKAMDLTRGKGAEVEFQFLQPVGAYPIMGSTMAEGKGTGMSYDTFRLRVNQARFPVDVGDTMTDLRSPVDYRRVGRPVAQSLMDSYLDQSILVHLAGARGFHDNIEWRVPVASHDKFSEIVVNNVKAPTKNRHYMAGGANGIEPISVTASELNIATTDLLTMDTVDGIRTMVESIALPPPAVKIPGDVVAEDSPMRVLLVSPAQYTSFAADPNFRQFQANALARASKAGNHPLFLGECGIWNGILIMKMPKPIRFYAGDEIKYCAANDSEAETVGLVPASFGTTHAIDRALLLGGQSLAQAFGSSRHGGMPFFWKEKEFDHDDKMELLIGAIQGLSKIRWLVDQGNGTKHYTDHGVTAIDTAVPIMGARS